MDEKLHQQIAALVDSGCRFKVICSNEAEVQRAENAFDGTGILVVVLKYKLEEEDHRPSSPLVLDTPYGLVVGEDDIMRFAKVFRRNELQR